MTDNTTNNLYGIWGSASDNVFAVGASGTILHYDGSAWSTMTRGTTNNLHGIWGSSSSDVFAIGVGGTILHYDGSAWSTMTSGTTTNHLRGIWGSSSENVFAVGDSGTIVHYKETPTTRPAIASISPNKAVQGQKKLSVTITGTYFLGATTVSFGSEVAVDNLTISSSKITADISLDSSAVLGARDVSVTTPAGTGTLTSGFTVTRPSPTIASIDPKQGVQGETLTVTIAGTYLEGATALDFGSGITVDNSTVDSDSQITANITVSVTATIGAKSVSVTTPAGTGTLGSGFEVTQKETPAKSSNSSKIWIGVGVGAGVLVVGAVIIYLVMRNRASAGTARPSRRK